MGGSQHVLPLDTRSQPFPPSSLYCLHIGINCPVDPDSEIAKPYVLRFGLDALGNEILPSITTRKENKTLVIQSRQAFNHPHLQHPWSGHVYKKSTPNLSFTISTAANIKTALLRSLKNTRAAYGPASCTPAKIKMMKSPIWSTWVKFKRDINQDKIVSFAEEIISRGFSASVMGIDDKWSSKYGEIRP